MLDSPEETQATIATPELSLAERGGGDRRRSVMTAGDEVDRRWVEDDHWELGMLKSESNWRWGSTRRNWTAAARC